MPKNTILAEIRGRDLGAATEGPIYTCLSLTYTYRLDGAGEYVAAFPGSDPKLAAAALKDRYLRFYVGGKHAITGVIDRKQRRRGRTKDTLTISGTCTLGALGENTVGDLELVSAGLGVNNGPALILAASAVSNTTFTLDASGHLTTNTEVYRKFSGESGLSALLKLAEQIGEHFRASTDGDLKVVWMRNDTATAPIRLVDDGGPTLHRTKNIAIIEDIASDENAERSINRIYPFGAGVGDARLTLADATVVMPAGYTMDTANNYIEWDDGQIYPSTRRSVQKSFSSIGVIDDSVEYTVNPSADAGIGATSIAVDTVTINIPDGSTLDLNGLGVSFVTLSSSVTIGANVLNVVALTVAVLATDTLEYSSGVSPANAESAANALAAAALAYLGRLADPSRMVSYTITARNIPDTVHVGMLLPTISQANGFDIDDNLLIREITRSITSSGRAPVQLRVSVEDWYETDEALEIARAIEEGRAARASSQPVDVGSVAGAVVNSVNGASGVVALTTDDVPEGATNLYILDTELIKLAGIESLADVTDQANVAAAVNTSTAKTTPVDGDWLAGIDSAASNILTRFTWANLKATLLTYFSTLYVLLAGKAGGQTVSGGTASGESLTLHGSAHATKGPLLMQPTSGNIGIGTSDVEAVGANYGAIQLGQTAYVLYGRSTNGIFFVDNAYYDGAWKRRTAAPSSYYVHLNGTHSWAYATTGVVDSAITWSDAMFIDAAGNVVVGSAFATTAKLHIFQSTLGGEVVRLQSPASNDDVIESVYQARIATTGATLTTLHTFTVPASTTYAIEARVIARRTGGASGTAEDGAAYLLRAVYANIAGVATLIGAVSQTVIGESVAGYDATLNVSGATVLCQVTGVATTNITWHGTFRIWQVGT